jgi:hypothetical protein
VQIAITRNFKAIPSHSKFLGNIFQQNLKIERRKSLEKKIALNF